jgi:glycosyltransferase involved in cell wall biosynthesis
VKSTGRRRLRGLIGLLHNRYRTHGGEERAVEDLAWLIPRELGEEVVRIERDSASQSSARAAAGLLRGGLDAEAVGAAVRRDGLRVVHAHNLLPGFGWRALAAARAAGARTVLHLHNYRLVCANGVCFTGGEDCTRCHGRRTWPGVVHGCRGARAEEPVYAVALALWQRRLASVVDQFVVPSAAALARLRELGAPVGDAVVVPSVQREFAERSSAGAGEYVLYAGRVAAEKGVWDAVAACERAGLPLVVAGDGPELEALRGHAAARGAPLTARTHAPGCSTAVSASLTVRGRVDERELAALRARAGAAIVPSRYHEILPLAALEAMAAGLPVVATAAGGLVDAVPAESLAPPGDIAALADRLTALFKNVAAGDHALARARERHAPSVIAAQLRAVYDGRTARA